MATLLLMTGCAAKPLAAGSYRAVAVAGSETHVIAPAMDAAALAARLGHPELEPMIGLKVAVATERLHNPLSDQAAQAVVDDLVADVSTLAGQH